MTLQQLLILAGLTDRGADPNAPLGNFQNPFNSSFNIATPSPFVPPSATSAPPSAPVPQSEPLPPTGLNTPTLKDSIVNGGLDTNSFAGNDFAEVSPEFAAVTQGPSPSDLTSPDLSTGMTSLAGTPGFGANLFGQLATMGLSAVPTAGPFLGLAARLIGLPNMIARSVTPNITLAEFLRDIDQRINFRDVPFPAIDPSLFAMNPTLSLDIEPMGPSPAFSDFEALSSAPDEPGQGGGEDEGEGEGGDD